METALVNGQNGTFIIAINKDCVNMSLKKWGGNARKNARLTNSIKMKIFETTPAPPVTVLPSPQFFLKI